MTSLDAPDPDRPLIRLTDPGSVVQAVPVVLGFHPQESLVVLSIGPEPKRLGLTLRGDLRDCRLDEQFVPRTADVLVRNGAHAALLVVFTDGPDEHGLLPDDLLVTLLADELESAGVEVREQLLVRDGRWWSYACTGSCCPREGTPLLEGTSVLQAQAVVEGRVLLPDRAALAATIAGPPEGSEAATRVLWELVDREQRLAERFVAGLDDGWGLVEHATEVVERFRSLVVRVVPPTEDELPDLLVGLDSRAVRDAVLGTLPDVELEAAQRLLVLLLRTAVPPWGVAPATMLAHCSWRSGGGAITNLALDRALGEDPDCVLARYVAHGMRYGVRPGPDHGVRAPEVAVAESVRALTDPPLRRRDRRERDRLVSRQLRRRAG